MAVLPKIERKYRAHFLDASLTATGTPNYVRIGKDNDDLSRTINYTTNETQNVWGETETSSTRQGDTMEVSPYYIRTDEPLGELLNKIDTENLELDAIKRYYVEVFLTKETETTGEAEAFRQMADVTPTAAGGPATDGVMVPFNLALSGVKEKGTWNMSTKAFTPGV